MFSMITSPVFYLAHLYRNLRIHLANRVESFGAQYITFGLFGLFNYPLCYFMFHDVTPQGVTSSSMRICAALLCIPLVLKDYWPARLKPHLPVYWYATLLYSLPFFGAYMLIANEFSASWLMNVVLGIFLTVLIVDWLSFLSLYAVGIMLGALCFLVHEGLNVEEAFRIATTADQANLRLALYMNIFAILIGTIFSRNKEKLEKEKLLAMKAVGSSVAHELRTPLITIQSGVSGAKKYLPQLIDTYQLAQAANLDCPTIQPRHLEILLTALDDVETETHFANTIINMLLVNLNRNRLNPKDFTYCRIDECIDEAIRRYPFNPPEQASLIQWEGEESFEFWGVKLLTIHVLFNLIKNALYYIEAANKGSVTIWLEKGKRFNRLRFKDTGKGISSEVLPQIFERFFSNTHNGTGIGLTFCKHIMQSFGGDIVCFSESGQFTEFVLSFPVLPATRQHALKPLQTQAQS